jgi:hypothetical protein
MKTYEIKDTEITHPIKGKKIKKQIIYYESNQDVGTPEFYKVGETDIKAGYALKS